MEFADDSCDGLWLSSRNRRRGGQGSKEKTKTKPTYFIDTSSDTALLKSGAGGESNEKEEVRISDNNDEEAMELELEQVWSQPPFDPKSLIGKPFIIPDRRERGRGEEGTLKEETRSTGSKRGLLMVDKTLMKSLLVSTSAEEDQHEEVFDMHKEAWPSMSQSDATKNGETVDSSTNKSLPDWSTIVKTDPKPLPQKEVVIPSDNMDIDPEEKKKKKKKKKEKKLEEPMTLELGSILDALQKSKAKADARPVKKITAGTVALPPPPLSLPSSSTAPVNDASMTAAKLSGTKNVLDSSAPSVMRGKERETPKKRKPSSLRKIIDKEREERKKQAGEGQPIPTIVDMQTVPQNTSTPGLHNRNYREYCTHLVTDKINGLVESLLNDLSRFQERIYKNEPLKFKSKRRFVCGLREVKKHLLLKHLKCVIVPPNLQRIQSPGGIDDTLSSIIESAKEQEVPLVFALNRRRLAFILKKKFNIGCIGIISCAGAEETYKKLMDQIRISTEQYQQKRRKIEKELASGAPATYQPQHNKDGVTIGQPVTINNYEDLFEMQTVEEEEEEREKEEEEDEGDDSVVPVSQWNQLFGEVDKDESIGVPSKPAPSSFSWNLEAPEFLPFNIPNSN
ncbi:PREDICTED: selenocysteine insertion sequence-binding protein 2-like [Amphimedon queenslandica]|uniref:Ribosomal protein eL8/eL30/eS12/Gadd45 domain-containing protein n=1 Tax=Amphimedon queenslandica TaxID=400682 RepID=A0A1X7VTD9_AMPQE|nr:PREDICTED: selenocysteine insertion sequence-binding protein 2-like [Amphimedon queenslandica]|eukprot:XP_003382852.1 PREDICTED: selenocysteine insertion sequence-binding protein 2-like [Amphimedon queenslandica]